MKTTFRGILLTSIAVLLLAVSAAGQAKKVTELTADTTPTSDDLTMTVNDPAGTPANRKVSLANLFFAMAPWNVCTDAGASDTYTCSFSPAPGSYQSGVVYRFVANTANTGAATVNFNGLGAKTIKKLHDQDLADNDIESGSIVVLVYDGTNMQMVSQIANAASSGAPTTATYITQTADGTLSNEQALGALATGILKSTTTTGVVSIATVDDISSPAFCSDAGSNDTYACSLSPSVAAYVTGTHYRFKANTANTGAATINLNSIAAKTIKKVAGGITTDLSDNDIRSGQWVDLVYDGTNMQMQSTLGNAASGGISGLTTGTIPKASSSTTLADSPLQDANPEIIFNGRVAKVNSVYSISSPNTNDYLLDRFTGLKVGMDGLKIGFVNQWFVVPHRHVGVITVGSNETGGGGVFNFPPNTPSQITSNQNNYTIKQTKFIRLSSDASRDITGLAVVNDFTGAQEPGQEHVLINVGSNDIVLKHENASSTAANRFLNSTAADVTLSANQAADIVYDDTTQRWRVFKRN